MHKPDYVDFRSLLDRLADVFGKGKPADELVQSYWSALRDVTLQTVKECADRHMKRGKFFPKPFELRPREDGAQVQEDAGSQAKLESAKAFSLESWKIMRRTSPRKFEQLWREAREARMEIVFEDRPEELEQARTELHAEVARVMRV